MNPYCIFGTYHCQANETLNDMISSVLDDKTILIDTSNMEILYMCKSRKSGQKVLGEDNMTMSISLLICQGTPIKEKSVFTQRVFPLVYAHMACNISRF